MNIDKKCINTLRFLAADAVQVAQSGHPGTAMGAAPTAFILWKEFLKHSPNDPRWVDRDRFVLSSGHASMLLYGLLHLFGYSLTIQDLKEFRQLGSKTPGHPEYKHVPGVETTTGPLGQGISTAVGMALAEAHLAAKYNRPDAPRIVDHYTYVLASDGDLMEGVSAEAGSLAGHLGLSKLIVFYDDNEVSIDGPTSLTFSEDVLKRYEAYGWHTQRVEDVLELDDIRQAITKAQAEPYRPSIIAIRSIIGYGAPEVQGTAKAHFGALGEEQLCKAKQGLGWPENKMFFVPSEVREFLSAEPQKGENLVTDWHTKFDQYAEKYPEEAKEFLQIHQQELDPASLGDSPRFDPGDGPMPTRMVNGPIVNDLASKISQLIGGCADLNPATQTYITNSEAISKGNYAGRNIHFGVREHAMGSITNGIVLHGGLIAYIATFLVFSDYLRPALRLAAMMDLKEIFVFTHDSVGLGEDGPTHQPIEHMMGLRSIPNLSCIRPSDANEVIEAWRVAVSRSKGPTCILLTRQPVPILDRTQVAPAQSLEFGAYILSDCKKEVPDVILIATGSEVHIALEAQEQLDHQEIGARVVAMPSWDLFEQQTIEYQNSVLPPNVKARVTIEAGSTFGWERWAGDNGAMIGINSFGASAPWKDIYQKFNITTDNLVQTAIKVINKNAV